jgi:cytochrome c peroxidase
MRQIYAFIVCLIVLFSCKKEVEQDSPPAINPIPTDTGSGVYTPTPYKLNLPSWFPAMPIPKENPLTVEGVALGKKLFNDKLLSANNTISCGSCHQQEYAFSDNKKFSTGINDAVGIRNSMPLFNLAWAANKFFPHRFMWDGAAPDLENQVLAPLANPIEMDQDLAQLERKLQAHPDYPKLFKQAFGIDTVRIKYVMYAIAQFERTLISSNSKYDLYKVGKANLTAEEWRGFNVFLNIDKAGCVHCHGDDVSPFFTNFEFENNGLDSIPTDLGLFVITGKPEDKGKFKVPSLRNLKYTAPYMHDGRFNTLEEVVEFYNTGVKQGETTNADLKMHARQGGLHLTTREKSDLVAFLNTLNDEAFIVDEKFK